MDLRALIDKLYEVSDILADIAGELEVLEQEGDDE